MDTGRTACHWQWSENELPVQGFKLRSIQGPLVRTLLSKLILDSESGPVLLVLVLLVGEFSLASQPDIQVLLVGHASATRTSLANLNAYFVLYTMSYGGVIEECRHTAS